MVLSLYVTLKASGERVVVGGELVVFAMDEAKRWYSTIVLKGWRTPAWRFSPQ
jgi:hypothetical protein